MELTKRIKQTEIGMMPADWPVVRLGDITKLKNGYAFTSDFFSENGPILITPANFKLTGGLSFSEKNTLRYSGHYDTEMVIENGDLVMVMTDLTPTCNLLGKAGIVSTTEPILHNQRIGKILLTNKNVTKEYLATYFNSDIFSRRMKSTATGSTVRHTSVGTINNTKLPLPSKAEQTAIATALSDADALIASLEKLIEKKRMIKQGVMQELLRPKEGWELNTLGGLGSIDVDNLSSETPPNYRFTYISLEDVDEGRLEGGTELVFCDAPSRARRRLRNGDILISTVRPNLKSHYFMERDVLDWICSTGFSVFRANKSLVNAKYIFYHLFGSFVNRQIESMISGSNYPAISSRDVSGLIVPVPPLEEQARVANILSEIDNEINILEVKLKKYRLIKHGMMQELLTGRIRLKVS